MGSIGDCCCCFETCTGTTNSLTHMTFAIALGLHPQSVTKPIRVLLNGSGECLKYSCASPSVIGSDGPISFPSNLKQPTCCAEFGFVTTLAEAAASASSPLEFHRDYYYTKSSGETGLSMNPCNGFAVELPYSNVWDYSKHFYITQIAKRIIDSVKVTFCPSVVDGVLKWTVTADVCWRVVYRFINTVYDAITTDLWAHKVNYAVGFGCIDPTIKKYCGRYCNFGSGVGEPNVAEPGYTDLSHNCAQNYSGGSAPPLPLVATDLGEPCSSGFPTVTSGRTENTVVLSGKQKRIIIIDRSCTLPGSLEFPYSALSGANGDSSVGWSNIPPAVLCTWQIGQVLSGSASSFTNYEAMTESWNIALT